MSDNDSNATKARRLAGYIGETVELWGVNYIYAGTLVEVDETEAVLDPAYVVYETGPLVAARWDDAQPLGAPWTVALAALESYGPSKKTP